MCLFIISPIHNRYIMAIGNTHIFFGLKLNKNKILDKGLWYLTPLSTIF